MKYQYLILLFCSLLFFPDTAAQAHGVRVFAWRAGENIKVEVAFRGSDSVRQAEITVRNAGNGQKLFSGTTGEDGFIQFPVPEQAVREKMDLKILADCGAGHRGEWVLKAEDYLESQAGFSSFSGKNEGNQDIEIDRNKTKKPEAGLNEDLIRRIIAEELDKELTPVKRILHENLHHKTDIRDLIGGVGWLLGLAGIAAWYKAGKLTRNNNAA